MVNKLESLIEDVPNFPKEGIMFKDITPILNDGHAFQSLISLMFEPYIGICVEDNCPIKFVGLESRGFILGAALAMFSFQGFVPIRKKGKLPRKCYQESYDLEYGSDIIELHVDALNENDKVVIVDDLIATGGTLKAATNLVEKSGAEIIGVSVIITLDELYKSFPQNKIDAPINSLFWY